MTINPTEIDNTAEAYADMLPRPFELHDGLFKIMQELLARGLTADQWNDLANEIDNALTIERNRSYANGRAATLPQYQPRTAPNR